MRRFALTAMLGCSFEPGTFTSTGDGSVTADTGDSGTLDTGDAPASCTQHSLPPSINVDATQWSAAFLTAPIWNCNAAGTTTIDSQAGTATSTSCALGAIDLTNNVTQTTGGSPVLVVRLRGLVVSNDHVVRLIGDKSIVFLVAGSVVVDAGGLVDAGAIGTTPGAGGSRAGECVDNATGLGTAGSNTGWGGGGGGFGTAGGQGCYDVTNGGDVTGGASLTPLRGGCSGGRGGATTATAGGAGGGAFQISATTTITIGATAAANLSVAGGGAPGGTAGGGNGGGSGGGILLVAPTMPTLGASGAARANGGAGSEGCNASCPSALDAGGDGHATDSNRALDASGIAGGGNGNDHGRRGGLANRVGSAALATAAGEMTAAQTGGRGGGGGGGGRIEITTAVTTPACD